jgi:hypothetical protein
LVDLNKLGDSRSECLPARQVVENRSRVLALSVDPGPGLRRLLILEPAIRVNDLDAVDHIRDWLLAGFGRLLLCRKGCCRDDDG